MPLGFPPYSRKPKSTLKKVMDNEMIYAVLSKTLTLLDIVENINKLVEYKESRSIGKDTKRIRNKTS